MAEVFNTGEYSAAAQALKNHALVFVPFHHGRSPREAAAEGDEDDGVALLDPARPGRFIERHRQFGEAMLLGAVLAYGLAHIPWVGGFLALCALVTAAAIGVLKELREDIAALFEPIAQSA